MSVCVDAAQSQGLQVFAVCRTSARRRSPGGTSSLQPSGARRVRERVGGICHAENQVMTAQLATTWRAVRAPLTVLPLPLIDSFLCTQEAMYSRIMQ